MRLFGPIKAMFPAPLDRDRYYAKNTVALEALGHSAVAYVYMKVVNLEDGNTYELQPDGKWVLFTAKGETGDSIEFHWDGTKLGVRIEGQKEYQYTDLVGPKGDDGNNLEFKWDGTKLGVRVEGTTEYSYVELMGGEGRSLEFDWDGTKLGVKTSGDKDYQYTDLAGPKGTSLEFDWDGTKLGVRLEGQEEFIYTDLKGEKGDIMYATFDILEEDGCLYMTTPDGYNGPQFMLNEEGYLEVVVNAKYEFG